MILVTGASGNVGHSVLEEVLKTGKPVRAMYRSEAEARKAPALANPVIADFSSEQSLRASLEGVDTVFLVCAPIPALVELETNVIRACQEGGVRHVVLNSALGAGDYHKSYPAWHRLVEDELASSGLEYTVLRPNSFMQNILAYNAPSIRTSGAFYGSYGDASISYLDVRDIAAVAARILAEPTPHVRKVYELNGPEAVTCSQLAQRISKVANRDVSYVDIPESAQRQAMSQSGMPEWQVDAILELQQYYKNGQGGEVTDVLPSLLGRLPVNLDSFLNEFSSSFRSQAAGA